MTVKLYILPSSTSSRKTKAFLEENEVEYIEQNMMYNSLSWEQLFEILRHTENGVEDILSTRSKDYMTLTAQGVNFDELSLTELHRVIEGHPKLLKAPIIVAKGETLVGYNEEMISMLGNRKAKKKLYLEALNMIRSKEDKELEMLKVMVMD